MSASQRGVPTETLRATSPPGHVGSGLARLAVDDGAASSLLSTGGDLWFCSAQRSGLSGLDRAAISSHPTRRTGRQRSIVRGRLGVRPLPEKLLVPRLRRRRLDIHPLACSPSTRWAARSMASSAGISAARASLIARIALAGLRSGGLVESIADCAEPAGQRLLRRR
jgi:hypothetical protein